MLGKRGDIRLDMLEQKGPNDAALQILAAAHAYQMSSARDELAPHSMPEPSCWAARRIC